MKYADQIQNQDLNQYSAIKETARMRWYSPSHNVVGLFEAVKYLGKRELMFLKGIKVRWLRVRNFNFLQKVIKTFDVDKKHCTAYASLDHYVHIPVFTSNLRKRKSETDEWVKAGGNKIEGVDFGIDIDFKEGSWRDAETILFDLLKIYQESGVNYAIWKTTHGFHIVIPYEQTNPDLDYAGVEKAREFYYLVAERLSKKFPQIDLSAYMETRVFRCPYMLDSEDQVILPLKYEELKLLFDDKIQTDPDFVMKNVRLKNRGVFMNGKIELGNFQRFVELIEKEVSL